MARPRKAFDRGAERVMVLVRNDMMQSSQTGSTAGSFLQSLLDADEDCTMRGQKYVSGAGAEAIGPFIPYVLRHSFIFSHHQ